MSWFNDRYYELWICIAISCTAASMHPWCIPISPAVRSFFFLHACLRSVWAKETLLSLLNPHIPLNVSSSCGTAPYWAHFYCLNLCTFCRTCMCVALLRMCVHKMLISASIFSAGPGPKKVQVPLISTDKACSLDYRLFFFLCIINQYSHNRPYSVR